MANEEIILFEDNKSAPLFFLVEDTVRISHSNPDGRQEALICLCADPELGVLPQSLTSLSHICDFCHSRILHNMV